MSNGRYLKQFQYSLEQDVCSLFFSLNVGASGAVSSISGGGLKAITKEIADGQYEIELSDSWNQILSFSSCIVDDALSNSAQVQIFENPASLQSDFKSDKKFKVQVLDFAGAAVNPTDGAQIKFEVKVRRSSVAPFDA